MLETLSEREHEVFDLVCQNMTNTEIAETVGMSEHTIKKDLRSIYVKLGIESSDPSDAHCARRRAMLYGKEKGMGKVVLPSDKKFSIAELRQIAKQLFPDKRIRVVNELLSILNIMEQEKIK